MPNTEFVTMTADVIDDLIEEVEATLPFVELRLARRKLFGILKSLRSLRDEAKR